MKKSSSNTNKRSTKRVVVKAPRVARSVVAVRPHLSNCAASYARVLTNPFGTFGEPPCIPDVISFPSFKLKTMSRGTFQMSSAQNYGSICVRPWAFTSAQPVGCVNSYGYTGNRIVIKPSASDPAYGGYNLFNDNPFDGSQNNLSVRLVGCGLRLRYIGTELSRGGRITLLRLPGSESIPLFSINLGPTTDELLSDKRSFSAPVDRRWHTICYYPDNSDLLGYVPFDSAEELDVISKVSLVAAIDGCKDGTFEFEIVQYWETQFSAAPMFTKSHSDQTGLSGVLSSIRPRTETAPAVAEQNLLSRVMNSLSDNFSGLVPQLVDAGAKALGGYLAGPAGAMSAGMAVPLLKGMSKPVVSEID